MIIAMIINNFKSFPKKGKLLGIDWGAKRIGIAISDPMRKFVFLRDSKDWENLLMEVSGIVIGLPLRLNGEDSDTTKKVRKFANNLSKKTDLPIILFDESLTSFEAVEKGAKKNQLDAESARVLLENAISFINRL